MMCSEPYLHYFMSLYLYIGTEVENQILSTKMTSGMLLIYEKLLKHAFS